MRILVINGPNLNMLGVREPSQYGRITLAEICDVLRERATSAGHQIEFFQSNCEGELVSKLHAIHGNCDLLLINGGAYSHTSIALRDALMILDCVKVEVHLSNVHARESFRHVMMTAAACHGVVAGLGAESYYQAMEGGLKLAAARQDA